MKRKLLFFLISIFSLNLSATHIMGGEITWVCIKETTNPDVGKYIFTLKIYRDCDGASLSTFSQIMDVWSGGVNPDTSFTLNWVSNTDISPACDVLNSGFPALDCAAGDVGAVEEYIYESLPISLLGTPPASGWHFTWDQCCRNGATSNLVLSSPTSPSEGFTLRASMFPYTDLLGNVLPANPCYDSSPVFKEQAKTILCIGYPFSYSNLGFDVELDSLLYAFDEPLDDIDFGTAFIPNVNPLPLSWVAPYTTINPFPGGVTLNASSGEISYNSNIAGNFASVIRVDAFKCDQIIASIYREIQIVLLGCGSLPSGAQNSPPIITAPLGNQAWSTTLNPSTGLPSYETSIKAGELVKFSVLATDNDINLAGNFQVLSLEIEGGQIDTAFALSNPATFTVTSSSPGNIAGDFLWQSNCDHMQDFGCEIAGGAFSFNIKAYDDFCPANGIVIATITINVDPPTPDLRCLSVDLNGGVELSLVYPEGVVDTNIKYDIYHSKQFTGNYMLIDSIYYPDSIYFHSSSNANTSQSFYYLLGNASCGTSIVSGNDTLLFSDTLSTILMNTSAVNMGITADLTWNNMHNPLLPSSLPYLYYLHYINNNNDDVIFSILPDTFAQIDADNCDYTPAFYVEIPDVSGCISKSSVGSVNLVDTIAPSTPNITDISVDANGNSVISWVPSIGSNHYLIYNVTNQGSVFIDSVHGEFSSTYTYLNSEADSRSEIFNIKAIDSCSNSMSATLNHNSIYLSRELDECAKDLFLTWNKYNSWMFGVSYYNLVVEETDLSGLTTAIIDTHLVDVNEYLVEGVIDKHSYNIYVLANDGDTLLSALSNQLLFIVNLPKKPVYNYIEYASINHDNGFVEINCLVDNTAIISHYDVMRSLRYENNFKLIGSVPFDGGATIHYTDESVKTSQNFYQYKIYPVDTCGLILSPPPVDTIVYVIDTSYAQTILLETEINLDYDVEIPFSVPYDELLEGWAGLGWENQYTNTLTFNEYDKWLGDVSEYRLYRSINGESFSLSPICTWERLAYPDVPLQFIDVVTTYGDGNGRFCYYIEAIEGDSTNYGPVSGGALSNVSCVSQTPIIFVPNTFTPNGDEHNEVFRPFTNFVSEEGYSFTIYNRSGSIIFSTNDPLKGWDGRLNGNMIQADNYIFQLQYINGVGEITKKTDIITLVR